MQEENGVAPADPPVSTSGDRGQAGGVSEEPELAAASRSATHSVVPSPHPESGAAAIEEAVADLDELDGLPVAEHVARFDAVHVALNVALSTIDRE
jgi:hypothetical protein